MVWLINPLDPMKSLLPWTQWIPWTKWTYWPMSVVPNGRIVSIVLIEPNEPIWLERFVRPIVSFWPNGLVGPDGLIGTNRNYWQIASLNLVHLLDLESQWICWTLITGCTQFTVWTQGTRYSQSACFTPISISDYLGIFPGRLAAKKSNRKNNCDHTGHGMAILSMVILRS